MSMTREDLHGFLRDRMGLEIEGLEDEEPLFSAGRLDSFSMVDLILFIESSTGKRMRARDVRMENLDSVARVLAFVEREDDPGAA